MDSTAAKPESEYPYAYAAEASADASYKPSAPDGIGEGGPSITEGKWEVGLCDCFTHCVPNCLMSCCCPCVSIAQISARLGMMTYETALILAFLIVLCTGGFGGLVIFIWLWVARANTRKRFQIPGNGCADCCVTCCCTCCAMAQLATHIKSYKPSSCDFSAQDTLPAYTSGAHAQRSYA